MTFTGLIKITHFSSITNVEHDSLNCFSRSVAINLTVAVIYIILLICSIAAEMATLLHLTPLETFNVMRCDASFVIYIFYYALKVQFRRVLASFNNADPERQN